MPLDDEERRRRHRESEGRRRLRERRGLKQFKFNVGRREYNIAIWLRFLADGVRSGRMSGPKRT
jgi:hypothetical protein